MALELQLTVNWDGFSKIKWYSFM